MSHLLAADAQPLPPPPPGPCRWRSAAVTWVERFSPAAFARRFRVLAQRGRLTKPFRHLIRQTAGEKGGGRGEEGSRAARTGRRSWASWRDAAKVCCLLSCRLALPCPPLPRQARCWPGTIACRRTPPTRSSSSSRGSTMVRLQAVLWWRAGSASSCVGAPRQRGSGPEALTHRAHPSPTPAHLTSYLSYLQRTAFEYVVKNALHHLGPGWGLHVYHGAANEWFVRNTLANVTGAQVCSGRGGRPGRPNAAE